jgi:ABC-type nitrate/sulfonate/bicarbonate transport system permease component
MARGGVRVRATVDRTEVAPSRTGTTKKKAEGRRFTRKQRVLITIVNLTLFCIAWEYGVVLFDIKPIILPKFSAVVAEIPEMHRQGILIDNLLISLRVYLLGMALSFIVSVPLGLLLGGIRILDRIVTPYLWVIYTTPLIILMPLILLWVGINDTARVLLVFISAVPAIVVVVMEGVKTVDVSLMRAARSFGARRGVLFTKVILPSTIPFIATGVKMGVSRGLIGLFVGELFTSADGMGYIIAVKSKVFDMPGVYAMLFIFIFFSIAMVGTAQYVERRLSAWRGQPTL